MKQIKELLIKNNPNGSKDSKRLIALFTFDNDKKKTVKFGSYNSITYYDTGDVKLRKAYKARHSALNESWDDIITKGALAYNVLWTVKTNNDIETRLKKLFKILIVKVSITKNKK